MIKEKTTEQNSTEVTNQYCYRCGYFWTPRSGKTPRTCPRCKSSRWDVPVKKEAQCKFCNHRWELQNIYEPCPVCHMSQMENIKQGVLHCNQCDHDWTQRGEKPPLRCPACLSTQWDQPKLNRLLCLKCGHVWKNKNPNPVKCPNCQCREWNRPVIKLQCRRCGYKWIPNNGKTSEEVRMCPSCKSKNWNITPMIMHCQVCGNKYTSKFNDRKGKCPACNKSGDLKKYNCDFCGNEWISKTMELVCPNCGKIKTPKTQIEEESFDIWSMDSFVLRYVYSDGFGCMYLWDDNDPIAAMYLQDVCRLLEITVENIVVSFKSNKETVQWEALYQHMYEHQNDYIEKIDYFMKRLGLCKFDATVLAIHFTGMGPEAISIHFRVPLEDIRSAFDRIMSAYADSGIIVDDTVFTENPFEHY